MTLERFLGKVQDLEERANPRSGLYTRFYTSRRELKCVYESEQEVNV